MGYIMLFVVDPCVCGPPVTDPPAATCCCTAWVSCGLVVVAVQPACPLAIEADNALTEIAEAGINIDASRERLKV